MFYEGALLSLKKLKDNLYLETLTLTFILFLKERIAKKVEYMYNSNTKGQFYKIKQEA